MLNTQKVQKVIHSRLKSFTLRFQFPKRFSIQGSKTSTLKAQKRSKAFKNLSHFYQKIATTKTATITTNFTNSEITL